MIFTNLPVEDIMNHSRTIFKKSKILLENELYRLSINQLNTMIQDTLLYSKIFTHRAWIQVNKSFLQC